MRKIWIGSLILLFTTSLEHTWKAFNMWLDIQNELASMIVSCASLFLVAYVLGNLFVEYGKKL